MLRDSEEGDRESEKLVRAKPSARVLPLGHKTAIAKTKRTKLKLKLRFYFKNGTCEKDFKILKNQTKSKILF
jgi:hypothetical protein